MEITKFEMVAMDILNIDNQLVDLGCGLDDVCLDLYKDTCGEFLPTYGENECETETEMIKTIVILLENQNYEPLKRHLKCALQENFNCLIDALNGYDEVVNVFDVPFVKSMKDLLDFFKSQNKEISTIIQQSYAQIVSIDYEALRIAYKTCYYYYWRYLNDEYFFLSNDGFTVGSTIENTFSDIPHKNTDAYFAHACICKNKDLFKDKFDGIAFVIGRIDNDVCANFYTYNKKLSVYTYTHIEDKPLILNNDFEQNGKLIATFINNYITK